MSYLLQLPSRLSTTQRSSAAGDCSRFSSVVVQKSLQSASLLECPLITNGRLCTLFKEWQRGLTGTGTRHNADTPPTLQAIIDARCTLGGLT